MRKRKPQPTRRLLNVTEAARDANIARAEQLQAEYQSLQIMYDREKKAHDEENRLRRAAEKERDETRNQFAELKHRLHTAETQMARQAGYIDRVMEDDVARDEVVTVFDPSANHPRQISKRDISYSPGTSGTVGMRNGGAMTCAEGRAKHQHWTSF